ncbi:hypothetical protein Bbelb_171910 [Branchiostoma belcheri]|nr:hypothetical protein Bbelb_171910 [Branchiostoma belcheri]
MPTCFYNALRIFGGIMVVFGLVVICIQLLSECYDRHFCQRDRVPFEGIGCVMVGVLAFGSSFLLLWCRGKKEHELRVEEKIEPKVHYTRASPGYNTESARQSADATPCNTPTSPEAGNLDTKLLCEKLDCVAMERECRNEGHCSSEVDNPHLSLNAFQQQLSRLTPSPHHNNMDSLRKIRQDYSVIVDETVRRPFHTPSVSSNVSKTFKKPPAGTASSSRRSSLTGSQKYCVSLVPYSGSSESLYSEEEEEYDDKMALLVRGSSRSLLTADGYTEESSRRGYFFFPAAKEARRDTWGNRGTFKKTPAFHNRWEQSELSPPPQLVQLYSSVEDVHCVQTTRHEENHHRGHMGSMPNNCRPASRKPDWSTSFEQVQSACEYESALSRAFDQACACEDCRVSRSQPTVVQNDGYSSDEERSEFGDSEYEMELSSARSIGKRPKTPFVGRKHGFFVSSDEEYVPSGKSASDRDSPTNRTANSSAAEDLRNGKTKMVAPMAKLTPKGHRKFDDVSRRSRSNSMGTSMVSHTPQTDKHLDPADDTFASQRKRSRSLDSKQIKRDSTTAKAKQARSRLRPGSPSRLVRQQSMRVPSAEERSNSESMLSVQQNSKYLSVPAPVYPTKGKKSQNADGRSKRTKDAKPQPKSLDSATSTLRRSAGHLCSNRSLYSSCPDLGCSSLSIHNLPETARDRFGAEERNGESKFDRHVEEWCARYLPENSKNKKQQVSTDEADKTLADPQVSKRPPKDEVDGNVRRTNNKVDHRHNERHPTKQPAQSKPVEHNGRLDVETQKNTERSARTSNPGSPSPRHRLKRSNTNHRDVGHGHSLKPNSIQREQSGGSTQKLYERKRTGDQNDGRRSHRTHVHDHNNSGHRARVPKNGHNRSYSKDRPRNKGGNSYDGDVETNSNGHREHIPKENAEKHVHHPSKLRQAVDRHRDRAHQMVDRNKERAHHIKDRIDSSAQHIVERHRERRHHIKDRLDRKKERAHDRAHQLKDRVKGHSHSHSKGRNNRSNSQPTSISHTTKQTRNMVRRNTTGTTPGILSSRPGGTLMSRLAPSPLTILTASSSSLQVLQKTFAS